MTDIISRSPMRTGLIALALGILPFFLFLGTSQTVTVNGAVVRDEQFNILGVVLAIVGIGLSLRIFLSPVRRTLPNTLVTGLAVSVCLLQLAASFDLVRPANWLSPESDLPALHYSGLSEANRAIVADIVERGAVENVTRDLMNRGRSTLDMAHRHMAYADVCYDSRYRIDYDEVKAIFAVLPEAQQQEILANAEQVRRPNPAPQDCSASRTTYSMGELVDGINQQMDMMRILRDGYIDLTPSTP